MVSPCICPLKHIPKVICWYGKSTTTWESIKGIVYWRVLKQIQDNQQWWVVDLMYHNYRLDLLYISFTFTYTETDADAYTYIYTHVHVHLHMRMHIHIYIHIYIHIHIHIYIHIHIHTQTYIHAYVHTYIRTYVHTSICLATEKWRYDCYQLKDTSIVSIDPFPVTTDSDTGYPNETMVECLGSLPLGEAFLGCISYGKGWESGKGVHVWP